MRQDIAQIVTQGSWGGRRGGGVVGAAKVKKHRRINTCDVRHSFKCYGGHPQQPYGVCPLCMRPKVIGRREWTDRKLG